VQQAVGQFDRVLVDHAHCEKKAAATALSLLSNYPDRERLVRRMSALAIEELRHFRAVHREILARGLVLGRDPGDPYARALMARVEGSGEARLLDRLLVAALIEARSQERLVLLGDALEDPRLARFYTELARAEGGHATLFVELATGYAGEERARLRLDLFAEAEAEIVASLPIEPRIH
jgi:tRNA-(ms[2]io[6]A)-hydroxylase